MRLKEKILYVVLCFFKIFLPFTKVKKNKILFVSLESDVLEHEFKMLYDELSGKGYELHCSLTKFEMNILGSIKYFFTCIHLLFDINTSSLVILDYNNYVVSKFKREGVKVLQLWHASGAIKKFGNAIKRDYLIHNYDYVIANAEAFRQNYAQAFGVKKEQVFITGIPGTDCLYQREYHECNRALMLEKFPIINRKKVVLYAPTFRGRLITGFKDAYMDVDKVQELLGNDYVIMYKMHPLLRKYEISKNPNIICCNEEELYLLFAVTDYLISDYSALIFDFSVLEKPMLFFTPDLDTYKQETGLFLDYEKEIPGPICTHEEEIVELIKHNDFDMESISKFNKKYHAYSDGKSLDRVLRLIEEIMDR
ncbi:CDP-glycerol glycerophosphotransferase family protein [Erysipelotrichaceae bacterium HCN-30851]